MHPMAARAFLNMQLSPSERERLRDFEKSLPRGRYLQGYEVCRMLNLRPKSVPDIDTSAMESLWTHYAKTQLNVGRTFEDEHSDIEPRTKQQEVHAWED